MFWFLMLYNIYIYGEPLIILPLQSKPEVAVAPTMEVFGAEFIV